ncbi:MAG: VWA domain-containing protein [Betaproteobacteria bacterium]|nr:VWA domain-containing protein [Betaproteobacteria bacterium]
MALGTVGGARARALRRTALALAILAAAMGPIALARPAVDTTEQKHQGAVILEIDTSKSMQKTDLQPNRLDAAKVAANQFLDSAPEEVLVGLVMFSDRAVVQVAPTLDRIAVRNALDRLEVKEGTALGDAVAAGLGSLSGAGAGGEVSGAKRSVIFCVRYWVLCSGVFWG